MGVMAWTVSLLRWRMANTSVPELGYTSNSLSFKKICPKLFGIAKHGTRKLIGLQKITAVSQKSIKSVFSLL